MTKKKKNRRKTEDYDSIDIHQEVIGYVLNKYPDKKETPVALFLWTEETEEGSFHRFRVNWLDNLKAIKDSVFIVMSIVNGEKSFKEK